jgi:hypothetical protein
MKSDAPEDLIQRVINSTLKQGMKSGAPEELTQTVINSTLNQGMKSGAPVLFISLCLLFWNT